MNPLQKNKVDISAMSEQEQKAFKMYGKLPAKNHLTKMQKERRYFDSAEYQLQKSGHGGGQVVGREIPTPQAVQHASAPGPGSPGALSSSPTANLPNPFAPAVGSPDSSTGALPIGIPGKPHPSLAHHRGSVGVGIAPADNENHNDIPHQGHARRLSESHRISPPGTLRDGAHPSSSFPIQHHSSFGASSPVKASSLARRLDEES